MKALGGKDFKHYLRPKLRPKIRLKLSPNQVIPSWSSVKVWGSMAAGQKRMQEFQVD